jgi:hypothetical protein
MNILIQERGRIDNWKKKMNMMKVTTNQVIANVIWKRCESAFTSQIF